MNWRRLYLGIYTLWAVVAPLVANAQAARATLPGLDGSGNPLTVEAALHQMSDRAAVIFVGTVAEVRRPEANGLASGVVEIQFHVEQAIRGCSGSAYTLREWGGLWNASDARFHVGQQLLLLLHAPGATGLSSPVGGMDGAIPLRASGVGVRSSNAGSAVAAEPVADLRWIGARLARPVTYRPSIAAPKAASHSPVSPRSAVSAAEPLPAAPDAASKPAQEASVATVVGMLRSWEVSHDATR